MTRPRPLLARAPLALAVLLAAAPLRGQSVAGESPATITGVVYDSLARTPLAGATVQLLRADEAARALAPLHATTDRAGAYRVAGVAPGSYLATFIHPRLDSLGLELAPRAVRVMPAGETRADLAVPSASTLIATICPAGITPTGRDSSALVVGFVRDARTLAPRGDATVTVSWLELAVARTGLTRERLSLTARTSASGWFALCGLPAATELALAAAAEGDSSGFVLRQLAPGSVARGDLFVGASTPDDSSDGARRGDAGLTGLVRAIDGRPVQGARVSLWGGSATALTNERGEFFLGALPAGSQTVEARAIGYLPARAPVQLLTADGATNRVDLALTSRRAYLDTVRVTTRLYAAGANNGFEARRRMGIGRFLDRAAIERKNAGIATDLLTTMPNVDVRPVVAAGQFIMTTRQRVLLRNVRGEPCDPDVWIDGVRISLEAGGAAGTTLDDLVSPSEIEAMEVYSRATSVPSQYLSVSGCGSLVIWTRSGAARAAR